MKLPFAGALVGAVFAVLGVSIAPNSSLAQSVPLPLDGRWDTLKLTDLDSGQVFCVAGTFNGQSIFGVRAFASGAGDIVLRNFNWNWDDRDIMVGLLVEGPGGLQGYQIAGFLSGNLLIVSLDDLNARVELLDALARGFRVRVGIPEIQQMGQFSLTGSNAAITGIPSCLLDGASAGDF